MAIELHHLNTHGMMEQSGKVLDGVVRLKERIAELENENAELKEQYKDMDVTHTVHIAKMNALIEELEESQRWRKCSEELPQNGQDVWAYDSKSKSVLRLEYEKSDEGEGFIVFPYRHDFLPNITQWMPFDKPKAPEVQ